MKGDHVEYLGVSVFTKAPAIVFRQSLCEAIYNRPFDGLQLDIFDLSFYEDILSEGGYLILSEDNYFGAYVKREGEIGSLFKNRKSTTPDVASFVLELAVKLGGKYFNAYGTHQLETLYVNNKFNPVARMKFDESLATKGWEKSSLANKPDVVFYAYSPNGIYTVGCGAYFDDWDDANNYSISLSKTLSYA